MNKKVLQTCVNVTKREWKYRNSEFWEKSFPQDFRNKSFLSRVDRANVNDKWKTSAFSLSFLVKMDTEMDQHPTDNIKREDEPRNSAGVISETVNNNNEQTAMEIPDSAESQVRTKNIKWAKSFAYRKSFHKQPTWLAFLIWRQQVNQLVDLPSAHALENHNFEVKWRPKVDTKSRLFRRFFFISTSSRWNFSHATILHATILDDNSPLMPIPHLNWFSLFSASSFRMSRNTSMKK